MSKLKNIDSLYFDLLDKRDSCLTGSKAPNFVVTTIDNEVLELKRLKGQVVMLNFWFTRCQPCIKEMPDLNKLVALYANKKIIFISFAPEDSGTLRKFFLEHNFNFKPVAKDETIRREKFEPAE